jgi:hypothetical protein
MRRVMYSNRRLESIRERKALVSNAGDNPFRPAARDGPTKSRDPVSLPARTPGRMVRSRGAQAGCRGMDFRPSGRYGDPADGPLECRLSLLKFSFHSRDTANGMGHRSP